jgi:toxin ParE1/3/4
MRPRLSRSAHADIGRIRQFGDEKFGLLATDKYLEELFDLFDLLCFTPRMAKKLPETQLGIRVHPYKAHNVYYTVEGKDVMIIRVLHGRQNWRDHI